MATANHFWIDAALGALVAAASALAASLAPSPARRPEAWAWRTAEASSVERRGLERRAGRDARQRPRGERDGPRPSCARSRATG